MTHRLTSKTLRWLVIAPTFAAAFFFILYLFYLLVWPPSAVTDIRMTILDERVPAGSHVRFEASLCKHVDAPAELHYAMSGLDDTGIYLDAGMEYGNSGRGCYTIEQHFHVPEDAPPGNYFVEVIGIVDINGIRTDRYRMPMGNVCVDPKEE